MPFITNRQVHAEERYPGVKSKVYIHKDAGAHGIQMGEVYVSPGCQILLHTHNVEEAIILLEGTLETVVGKEKRVIRGGTTLLATAGVPHSLVSNGEKAARFIYAYPSVNVTRTLVSFLDQPCPLKTAQAHSLR